MVTSKVLWVATYFSSTLSLRVIGSQRLNLADKKSNEDAAKDLNVSLNTVKKAKEQIFFVATLRLVNGL